MERHGGAKDLLAAKYAFGLKVADALHSYRSTLGIAGLMCIERLGANRTRRELKRATCLGLDMCLDYLYLRTQEGRHSDLVPQKLWI